MEPLGVTVMPEWFQHEGIDPVLDRLQGIGAMAIATSPYVMAESTVGEGGREPPADGDAGRVRPLDRSLWGKRELSVRTAPSMVHDSARYGGLRYQPSSADALTHTHGHWLDRLLDAARARGINVYLQVMAASPPGYRVQFSEARAEDRCLGPDGLPHERRVDRNASLASPQVVTYVATLLVELAERYPGVAGFRLDWPEYPPYDFRSALFDFNPAALAEMARAGHDPKNVAADVARWAAQLGTATRSSAARGPTVTRDALLGANWGALTASDGPLVAVYDAKRQAVLALLRACRVALDSVAGRRRRLEPQIFPPPFQRISGFPVGAIKGVVDAIGVKLYTMHWPMLARYWARDLLAGTGGERELDAATAAVTDLFGFSDALDSDGATLRYPEPHEAHPAGTRAQRDKLLDAARLANGVPVRAFVHSYGPESDFMHRLAIASATGLPLWINRYGYLSDAKLGDLKHRSFA
ncbi:MAG: hypothetical protein ABI537_15575 [Casimicrobiaceae bacterium]